LRASEEALTPASALPELSGETAATPSLPSAWICRLIVDWVTPFSLLVESCRFRDHQKGLQLL